LKKKGGGVGRATNPHIKMKERELKPRQIRGKKVQQGSEHRTPTRPSKKKEKKKHRGKKKDIREHRRRPTKNVHILELNVQAA